MQLPYSMTFGELKDAYIRAVNGEDICKRQGNNSHIRQLVESWKYETKFYGPASEQVIEWLHKGYYQPGLSLDPPVEPVRKRRRLMYGDEGELQIDLMYSGHDYPFLAWTRRETLPGMRIGIRVNFVATTNVDIIIDYYRWVLRALIALETSGIDLEVYITTDSIDMFQGDSSNGLLNNIQVKKEGRQTDFTSWSPMLSPGGYRHLTFLAYIIGSDANGKTATTGLGRGTNMTHPWSVAYDPEERELRFGCPWAPSTFPEEEMETQLRMVLAEARRAA